MYKGTPFDYTQKLPSKTKSKGQMSWPTKMVMLERSYYMCKKFEVLSLIFCLEAELHVKTTEISREMTDRQMDIIRS